MLELKLAVVIDRPRNHVWQLLDNPDNLKLWQPTLVSITPRSGEPGQTGSVSELVYLRGKRKCALTETIIVRNQPDEFSVRYDAPGVRTECVNQFIAVDDQKTRWEATNIITFSGVFRLFGWMMKGRIFARIQADLRRFKALAESTPEN